MSKKWFQIKEQSAGMKRLLFLWYLYKFFGEIPVRLIADIVAIVTYFVAKEQKNAVKKYLNIAYDYTKNESVKDNTFNRLKLFMNYANSLVDKMISFSGNLNCDKIVFANSKEENSVQSEIESGKGVFFITTHVGNAELIRTLLFSPKYKIKPRVNIFLKKEQCKIFNEFIEKISKDVNLETFAVEEIGVNTSILIKERLEQGEMVFMAGDRVSAENTEKVYKSKFLGKLINLPIGTIVFAELMDSPIFFINCIKDGKCHKIYAQKFVSTKENKKERLEKLKDSYGGFLEKSAVKTPYQYYNFFDIFED